MLVRYDPVMSELRVETTRGVTMTMTGQEADIIGEVLDYIADHPEEWHRARRESVLAIEGGKA